MSFAALTLTVLASATTASADSPAGFQRARALKIDVVPGTNSQMLDVTFARGALQGVQPGDSGFLFSKGGEKLQASDAEVVRVTDRAAVLRVKITQQAFNQTASSDVGFKASNRTCTAGQAKLSDSARLDAIKRRSAPPGFILAQAKIEDRVTLLDGKPGANVRYSVTLNMGARIGVVPGSRVYLTNASGTSLEGALDADVTSVEKYTSRLTATGAADHEIAYAFIAKGQCK
jgi:hypothetical protein